MYPVLIAQFLTAMADNILLFVLIGVLKVSNADDWQVPILQQVFLLSFILFAPFVGKLADGIPKGRVMLFSNTLKFIGVLFLFLNFNTFVCYTIVGIGACIYSPAKYGILKELRGDAFLVKANAMMESSTIAAILLGVVLGGLLADSSEKRGSFTIAFLIIAVIYLAASLANLFIPKLKPLKSLGGFSIAGSIKDFIKDTKTLYSNKPARIALLGTGLFFGIGATMRFLLIDWVPVALNIKDNQTPANLSAFVAVGIVIGSIFASKIPLNKTFKILSAGVGMGVSVILLSVITNIYIAGLALVLTGFFGGLFLIPLNAMLQRQGHKLVGGGHAVAIQNFTENIIMFFMLLFYIGMSKSGASIVGIAIDIGLFAVICMISLRLYSRKVAIEE